MPTWYWPPSLVSLLRIIRKQPPLDLLVGDTQQTKLARAETLRQIIAEYITKNPASAPKFSKLKEEKSVVGSEWSPDKNKERDNRGKVYLYFSPDDATVGLPNIIGMGCWGVDEKSRSALGARFFQRMFASPDGGEASKIGSGPATSTVHFKRNITWTWDRKVNAEALKMEFEPEIGLATLPIGPIDATIALTNFYNIRGKEGMRSDKN